MSYIAYGLAKLRRQRRIWQALQTATGGHPLLAERKRQLRHIKAVAGIYGFRVVLFTVPHVNQITIAIKLLLISINRVVLVP
jgi:hypothetical protein